VPGGSGVVPFQDYSLNRYIMTNLKKIRSGSHSFYSTARFVKKGHLCFAGVITPTLVVAGVLGLEISTRWV